MDGSGSHLNDRAILSGLLKRTSRRTQTPTPAPVS
jgi:hypothetical protein